MENLNHLKLYEDFDLGKKIYGSMSSRKAARFYSFSGGGVVPLFFRGDDEIWFKIDGVNKYNDIFRFNLGYYTPDYEMNIDLDYDPNSKDINFYTLKVDGKASKTNVSETEETKSYLDKYLRKKRL